MGIKNDLLNTGWGHFRLCGYTHTHTHTLKILTKYLPLIKYPPPYKWFKTILLSQNQHILSFLHPILMCSGKY